MSDDVSLPSLSQSAFFCEASESVTLPTRYLLSKIASAIVTSPSRFISPNFRLSKLVSSAVSLDVGASVTGSVLFISTLFKVASSDVSLFL